MLTPIYRSEFAVDYQNFERWVSFLWHSLLLLQWVSNVSVPMRLSGDILFLWWEPSPSVLVVWRWIGVHVRDLNQVLYVTLRVMVWEPFSYGRKRTLAVISNTLTENCASDCCLNPLCRNFLSLFHWCVHSIWTQLVCEVWKETIYEDKSDTNFDEIILKMINFILLVTSDFCIILVTLFSLSINTVII